LVGLWYGLAAVFAYFALEKALGMAGSGQRSLCILEMGSMYKGIGSHDVTIVTSTFDCCVD